MNSHSHHKLRQSTTGFKIITNINTHTDINASIQCIRFSGTLQEWRPIFGLFFFKLRSTPINSGNKEYKPLCIKRSNAKERLMCNTDNFVNPKLHSQLLLYLQLSSAYLCSWEPKVFYVTMILTIKYRCSCQ